VQAYSIANGGVVAWDDDAGWQPILTTLASVVLLDVNVPPCWYTPVRRGVCNVQCDTVSVVMTLLNQKMPRDVFCLSAEDGSCYLD
jgi:hypothetical protein